MHLFLFTNSTQRELVSICTHTQLRAINFPWIIILNIMTIFNCVIPSVEYEQIDIGSGEKNKKNYCEDDMSGNGYGMVYQTK